MLHERNSFRTAAILVTAILLAGAGDALAQGQKSPGGLTGGARLHPGSQANQRSSRSIRHARSYTRGIYGYSRDAAQFEPSVAKVESIELERNIVKAKAELAPARVEAGKDADHLAALDSIEKRLTLVEQHHKSLHMECCKEGADTTVCMEHCNQILLELDKAQAEQDALIRSIEIKGNAAKGAVPARQS